MKIEHVAMYVADLERSKHFFMKYFQAVPSELYCNGRTHFRSYFLSFDGGARLELMNMPDIEPGEKRLRRSGFVHIALSAGSREAVDALTKKLEADGFAVASHPRTTGDGYYESCVLDWEGNQIEITVSDESGGTGMPPR